MKGRLDLENFSGQTAEVVRQDFHSTLLLCNLESEMTRPTATALQEQSVPGQHPKQINQAVAYRRDAKGRGENNITEFVPNTSQHHTEPRPAWSGA